MADKLEKVQKRQVGRYGIAITAIAYIALSSIGFSAEPRSHNVPDLFTLADVFKLEYASDPQIAPNGQHIVYVRNSMDIMTDHRRSDLWILESNGSNHHQIATEGTNPSSPRWSPRGDRLAYISKSGDASRLHVRMMDSGLSKAIGDFPEPPSGFTWSPDGKFISFTMFVPDNVKKPFAQMPQKPEGAEWAEPVRLIESLVFRIDGAGFVKSGNTHLFIIPAEGPVARQITSGAFNHDGDPAWSSDASKIYISANRHDDWEYDALNSEIYELDVGNGEIRALTDRTGPDTDPVVSPDGTQIAYIGFDDEHRSYEESDLYVMDRDGSNKRLITGDFGRSVESPVWQRDGNGLYFLYSDKGDTKVGFAALTGAVTQLAQHLGGTNIGRPYASGSFSVAETGDIAFTTTGAHRPADVAITGKATNALRLTGLNDDLFRHKDFGEIEEIWFESSLDQRPIQGWIAKPPGFNQAKKYPLILEIHGGPDANYGNRFSAEIEIFTAAGYVVLFTNPRGSTSYGAEFAGLTNHTYPRDEYFDLMSGVDELIGHGYVDERNLFVTGGSAGGVLASWIIGKTNRFRAAAVVNPAMNWVSYALTTDRYDVFSRYFFPGYPWDRLDHYWKRSPLSLIGNVNTPTMLLTGEADYRTPIAETEQFYQALKLRRVEAAMIRIPGASHDIAARPSNLIAKVANIIAWFDKHRTAVVSDQV
jgi:dipeptidyl aminopeptidase/acylaminoacyl peptidase